MAIPLAMQRRCSLAVYCPVPTLKPIKNLSSRVASASLIAKDV